MKIYFLIFLLLLSLTSRTFAAPSISGVSGTVSNGSTLTITGFSFGTNSNGGPMLYDNFDALSNGATIANNSSGTVPPVHAGGLAGYTQWEMDGGGAYTSKSIVANTSGPHTNSTAHARATFTDSSYWGLNLFVPYTFATGNELYISFYYRFTKTGASFPRQSKTWIAYDSSFSDKAYWSTAYDNCEGGGYRTHITEAGAEHHFALDGNAISGEWVRFESYLKQSSAGGANGRWVQSAYRPTLGTPTRETYDSGASTVMRTSSANWSKWTFGGAYYDMCGTDPGTIEVDDFYMDDQQSRVELCNTATWSARTKCELQQPNAWSSSSITATARLGYFTAGTAYVYVVDNMGTANSAGFAVTIGEGSSGGSPPNPPSNLQAN